MILRTLLPVNLLRFFVTISPPLINPQYGGALQEWKGELELFCRELEDRTVLPSNTDIHLYPEALFLATNARRILIPILEMLVPFGAIWCLIARFIIHNYWSKRMPKSSLNRPGKWVLLAGTPFFGAFLARASGTMRVAVHEVSYPVSVQEFVQGAELSLAAGRVEGWWMQEEK
jgi:hypothetical protein